MPIRRGRADAPQRGRPPLADHTAVKLYLVKARPNIVVLEVAVDAAHRVSTTARQPTLPLSLVGRGQGGSVGQVMQLALHALGFGVIGDFQLEKAAIAVVALRVVGSGRIIGKQVPIRGMAGSATGRLEVLLP